MEAVLNIEEITQAALVESTIQVNKIIMVINITKKDIKKAFSVLAAFQAVDYEGL